LAQAAFISFDPDGPGGVNAPQTIGGLDWAVGNALRKSSIPLEVGSTFQQYYQATLAGVINTNGVTVAPAGLNSTFEITAVASVTKVVASVGVNGQTTTVVTANAAVQSPYSFFEIWYQAGPNSNSLAGTGYNDGQRIMLATPTSSAPPGTFTFLPQSLDTFDQFGANDYPGIQSVVGSGGDAYDHAVNSFDPSFFLDAIQTMSFNTSLITPFKEQNPSHLFVGVAGGGAPTIIPLIGTINGASGPDIQLQADGNVTFTAIPEPTLAAGVGATVVLSLLSSRRRSE